MKYEAYSELTITDDFGVVDFISIGKNGSIPKRITFTYTGIANVYMLTFGDVNENNEIDDYITSNNGDRNKLLATIFKVVDDYTRKYPNRWIAFTGSTKERTRLYRMAISLNLDELSMKFDIYGFTQNDLVRFAKNMKIESFFIKRKII